MSVEDELAGAFEALHANRLVDAAEHLRRAWAVTRYPGVADRLDELERRLRRELPAQAFDHDDAGLEYEASSDAAWVEAATRLADPRLSTLLLEALLDPPHVQAREAGNGVEEFWASVLAAFESLQDVRAAGPLRAFGGRIRVLAVEADREAAREMYTHRPLGPWIERAMTELAEQLATRTTPAPSKTATAWLERIAGQLAPEREEIAAEQRQRTEHAHERQRLREAVAAAPDDDAPRHAYATWLVEHGEPQGHFIRMQLGRPGEEPWTDADDLLEDGRLRWAEELAPLAAWVDYARGLPVAIALASTASIEPRHLDDVTWATVERIDGNGCLHWGERPEHAALLRSPRLRGLRCLDQATPSLLLSLRHDALPLTTVGFDPADVRDWDALLDALGQYPALETVHLGAYQDLDPSHVRRVGEAIPRWPHLALSVRRGVPELGALLDALSRSACETIDVYWSPAVEGRPDWLLRTATFRARFTRDEHGRPSVLRVEHRPNAVIGVDMASLIAVLDSLPQTALTSFELVLVDEAERLPHPDARRAAEEALRRFALVRPPSLPAPYDPEARARGPLAMLSSPDEIQVQLALDALTELRLPAARDPIASLLRTTDSGWVRWSAVRALVAIADASVVPSLCEALAKADAHQGAAIAELLGALAATEAVGSIDAFVQRCENSDGQAGGLAALAMLQDAAGIPRLREVLRARLDALVSGSADVVRRRACDSLGILGAVEAREEIRELYRRGDVYDRRSAVTALGLLGDPSDLAIVTPHRRADDLYPRGRALLAQVLLDPAAIDPGVAQTLADSLAGWSASDAAETTAWSLVRLGLRVPHERPPWRTVGEAVRAWCERERRSQRARWIAEARASITYRLAVLERITDAWPR